MKTANPSSIKFFTLGCKVNQYETQELRERFQRADFAESGHHQAADLYVINTCTVTHRADSDSLNLIRRAKRENPKAKIIVSGCLTELDEDRIKETEPGCLIVRNKDKDNLLNHLKRFNGLNWQNGLNGPNGHNGISYFKGHTRAFLKIQDGCNNLCSYCKVPLVRGRSRSKAKEQVIKEAKNLVKSGFKEIVLTGICLGSYGKDLPERTTLVDIIGALEKVEGLLRIRLSSIEAKDITHQLIDKISTSKKLCRHLHVPIQSGDDQVLKRMKRNYTRKYYLDLIKKIKKTIPGIAITTDVLVGFPGESAKNFSNTIELIRRIKPLKVHIFPYSRREGTQAACKFSNQDDPLIVKKRIAQLKQVADKTAREYRRKFLNRALNVLIEGNSGIDPKLWEGYSDNYIKVLVRSDQCLKNRVLRIRLNKSNLGPEA